MSSDTSLTGSVERITYYNPENGYSVVRLRPEARRIPGMNRDGLVTVVGNLPELSAGEYLRLTGAWINHPKHGLQFQVEICEQALPATTAGIQRYLGSGLVRGIGQRLAERIVAYFGAQTLDVIENHPERLQEVPDIGAKRAAQLTAAWEEQKQIKEIMLFLHSYGVSTALAVKIYKTYGAQAFAVVKNDPYRLARDIYGVGFKTADKIAQALGLSAEHPSRLEAGLIYALNRMVEDGHTYAPRSELLHNAAELLGVEAALLEDALTRLVNEGRLTVENLPLPQENSPAPSQGVRETPGGYTLPAVYLTPLHISERGVAEHLRNLGYSLFSRLSDIPPALTPLPADLSPEQQQAIRAALSQPVSVLTGGPGTGKTTAIRTIITLLESAGKTYALAAPTGRAAKRLSEATGRPASTIHRLLGYSPSEGFKINADSPLPVDLLVVDEASMLDIVLAYHLSKALAPGTHLLLVGDVDQLPSVGSGDVLRDIIASGSVPVTRLSVIFRQAAGSTIITNAHRINRGEMPLFPVSTEANAQGQIPDFFLFPAEAPEEAAQWVVDVVTTRIPQKFGFDPLRDIQVLTPMYRGPVGVHALNERLQALLNPPASGKPEKRLLGQIFRVGDKVMQVQNDYDKEVFNGDIGTVSDLSLLDHALTVTFDDRPVTYDWMEADQLVLAYAISVHKSQGAEFPVVVMPLVTQHYLMLQRNLLYTGLTRARKLCVLVGSRRAINIAVRNDKVSRRYTALDFRLR
ncbi:MAG: ATP-dependent RecD-like DNA helicase [Anaerolineales bacterium]